ncbi:unnamed protein product, partial [Brassica rapa subsp. trilocularis]
MALSRSLDRDCWLLNEGKYPRLSAVFRQRLCWLLNEEMYTHGFKLVFRQRLCCLLDEE